MTMSNIVVHCCYGVVLQAPKNVVVYCYWGVVLQEQKKKKTKTNNVIIPCHFGVVVQVQKNDVEELRCLSLFVVVMVWYCMHEKMTIINYDLHHCCSVV